MRKWWLRGSPLKENMVMESRGEKMKTFEKWWKINMPKDIRYESAYHKALLKDGWNAALGEAASHLGGGSTPAEDRYGREPDKVKIEVSGGVAEVVSIPVGITVEIEDHDNEETGQYVGTPVKNQSSEPDKVKPLAQYLDEYIEHEVEINNISPEVDELFAYNSWRELLQQALDAYQSTENVKIRIEPA